MVINMKKNMRKYSILGAIKSTPNAKLIYAFLNDICNGKGTIKISHREISQVLGISRSTVGDNTRRLKNAGYLRIEPTYNEYGGRQANRFRICRREMP